MNRRRVRLVAASAIGGVAFFVAALGSMAGPHQLDFLGIIAACDAALVALAAL